MSASAKAGDSPTALNLAAANIVDPVHAVDTDGPRNCAQGATCTTPDNGANDKVTNDCDGGISLIMDPSSKATEGAKRVDTVATTGLRGILSVHIMIFHSFLYSKWNLNLLGSVQMPFFFLISGYVFGLSEGRKLYERTPCCGEMKSANADKDQFNGKHFYQRRIARTLPLYYLTNLLCVPLVYLGHSSIQKGTSGEIIAYVLTAFVSTTWLGLPIVLNGPSWFVSTIWFFYWIFPSLLPRLQRLTNSQKQKWIRRCYWIQMGIAVLLHLVWTLAIPDIDGMSGIGFYFATFWPPSRLPVFVMGVLAGLLRKDGIPVIESQSTRTAEQWALQSDLSALSMLALLIGVTVLHNWPFESVLAEPGFWLQLVLPWWMLQMISALTFDEGKSRAYRLLSGKMAIELGRISYALYLIHEPLRQFLCWFINGTVTVPHCDSLDVVHTGCRSQMFGCDWYDFGRNTNSKDTGNPCDMEWMEFEASQQLPVWLMPILWAFSLLFARVLNRLIEEPTRKWLRPRK